MRVARLNERGYFNKRASVYRPFCVRFGAYFKVFVKNATKSPPARTELRRWASVLCGFGQGRYFTMAMSLKLPPKDWPATIGRPEGSTTTLRAVLLRGGAPL